MNYCPYCAQGNTHKDKYGYCRVYNCFDVSGYKDKLKVWVEQLKVARRLPEKTRNMFDGCYYPKRNLRSQA